MNENLDTEVIALGEMLEYTLSTCRGLVSSVRRINKFAGDYENEIRARIAKDFILYDLEPFYGLVKNGAHWVGDAVGIVEQVKKDILEMILPGSEMVGDVEGAWVLSEPNPQS